jgi:hypothetical protein
MMVVTCSSVSASGVGVGHMSERGDGAVFRVCREVQRRRWDPPFHEIGPQIETRRKFASA